MTQTVIKVENLSKKYRLGLIGSGTLKDDVIGWWYRMRGKPDPTLQIGQENQLNTMDGDYVWALRDINLEVKQGERLGIIGKNGAGKSTLLKILSRVTGPTTGHVKVKGRIASLLEVGTGFHKELTGRENIFLNGAILGMKRPEIRAKLDEIVDFAGVAKYLDTPVKRYSSGMYVRLAFAVAAHLEPDILVVDEVLAVGDAEFQKKAIGKMQEVSDGEGRTVLFVSHNMNSIIRLCQNCILLENGSVKKYGQVNDIVDNYLKTEFQIIPEKSFTLVHKINRNNKVSLLHIFAHTLDNKILNSYDVTKKIGITFNYQINDEELDLAQAIIVTNEYNVVVFISHDIQSIQLQPKRKKGYYFSTAWIPENLLTEGTYIVGIGFFSSKSSQVYMNEKELITFKVYDLIKGDSARGNHKGSFPGIVRPKLNWYTKLVSEN